MTDSGLNSFRSERINRLTDAQFACDFGICYLEDTISRLLPTDLMVLGALTGSGKTELSTRIAEFNATKGKAVCYVALEGDRYEIEQRIKYREVSRKYYQRESDRFHRLNFRDWKLGRFDDQLSGLEEGIDHMLNVKYENLKIIYPTVAEFFRKDLELMWEAEFQQSNLIIIDHLHYIDHEESSEHVGVKKNVAKIRTLVNRHKIPVILVSHLRKAYRGNDSIVPQIEELHGSSEISKQANHVVSFAPCYRIGDYEMAKPTTAFEVLKTRWACGKGYIGLVNFDYDRKQYEDEYKLFKVKDRYGTEAEPVEYQKRPFWAEKLKPDTRWV